MRSIKALSIPIAAALLGVASASQAAVLTLTSVAPVSNGFQFNYQLTLGPDEGLNTTSSLVLFDFAGLVAGTISDPFEFDGTSELTTATPFIIPGQSDDPNIDNLVFTYNAADFRTTGGPFTTLNINGFSAVSTFNQTAIDAFTSFTIKNNPAGSDNSLLIQLGTSIVPNAVPEPATWAMMIGGFGLIGLASRRRRAGIRAVAA